MKKVLVVILMVMIPVMVFGMDFSYSGLLRTRTTQISDTENYYDHEMWGGEFNPSNGEPDTMTYSDYRLRLFTNATFSDALNLVWGIEVNGVWGDEYQNRDEVSVQTKHLYLDFTPDMVDMLKIRVGLQPFKDVYQGAIFDEDAVGVTVMPELDFADFMVGYFVFHDEEVNGGDSYRFYTFDAAKDFGAFNVKAEVLYAKDDYESLKSLYYGIVLNYTQDNIEAGAHYVYNDNTYYVDNYDDRGHFIYGFAKYTFNEKMAVKLHLGMSPGDITDDDDYVSFMALKPYFNPYGLEYLYAGKVMDEQKVISSPGYDKEGWAVAGQNVFAANVTYDMFYLNAGMITMIQDDESESFGTEIDLGMDMPLVEGLDFSAVYAIFMPGDYFENTDTAHELSAKLQYNF